MIRNERSYHEDYRDWAKNPSTRRMVYIYFLAIVAIAGLVGYDCLARSASQKPVDQFNPQGNTNFPSLNIKI